MVAGNLIRFQYSGLAGRLQFSGGIKIKISVNVTSRITIILNMGEDFRIKRLAQLPNSREI